MAITSDVVRTGPSPVATMNAPSAAFDSRDRARHAPLDPAAIAFGPEHRDDVLRRAVAEELAQLLLVVRDPVPLDQRDEIAGRVPRERGAAEIRILREVVGRAGADVREVAAPAARDADLLAELVIVLDDEHAAAALPRLRRAHHAGGARADHDDVVRQRPQGRPKGAVLPSGGSERVSVGPFSYGPKKSRTLSMNDFARGLCAPGSFSLIASNSRRSSFCRAVSFTGVSTAT